jgi:hypothetical protein
MKAHVLCRRCHSGQSSQASSVPSLIVSFMFLHHQRVLLLPPEQPLIFRMHKLEMWTSWEAGRSGRFHVQILWRRGTSWSFSVIQVSCIFLKASLKGSLTNVQMHWSSGSFSDAQELLSKSKEVMLLLRLTLSGKVCMQFLHLEHSAVCSFIAAFMFLKACDKTNLFLSFYLLRPAWAACWSRLGSKLSADTTRLRRVLHSGWRRGCSTRAVLLGPRRSHAKVDGPCRRCILS